MKTFSLVSLFLYSSMSFAQCFETTMCSTGEAPRYILCGRGQDCSKAKDLGFMFKKDCTVSRWLGDAMETLNYSVKGKELKISRQYGEEKEMVYLLSDDQKTIRLKSNSQYAFSATACEPKK